MINKMKHIAIFIAFLMLSAISYAQKLTVESFKLVSENAAATENVVKDINDTPCAILRIKTTEKGLKLGGNVVGTALTNGKEYIANVATGTKKITIVGKETYPLTVYFSEYGINSLKSNASYEMILKTSIISTEVTGEIGGHEYVDLGLSVKWATCNVGASKTEDLGNFYRYGETVPYDGNRPYTFCEKYGEIPRLSKKEDVAYVKWGGSWRMPTQEECRELKDNCEHIWTTKNGVVGMLFIAKNGNKLFLPASDWNEIGGEAPKFVKYWSSEYSGINEMKFTMADLYGTMGSYYNVYPNDALNVRPVSDFPREIETWQYDYSIKPDGYMNGYGYVDLGLSVKWATTNVGAQKETELGLKYCWGETDPKDEDPWVILISGRYKFGMIKNDSESWSYDSSSDKIYGNKGHSHLKLEDDIASVSRKGTWRIPSKEEIEELISKCTWTWTYNYKNQGVKGYIVTSKMQGYTDKSIFLPSSEELFWSNTRMIKKGEDNEINTEDAYAICFNELHFHLWQTTRTTPKYIRSVCK